MRIRLILAAASFMAVTGSGSALAQGADNYSCTFGDLTRRIEIVRETGVLVPCEVHYYKDTEAPGEQQVLWRAQSEEGYCEARATEFVEKLVDWGWDCGSDASQPDAAPEEAAPEEETPAVDPEY